MRYGTPTAFRAALETRLMDQATAEGSDVQRLRRRVVFDRLLARLSKAQPGDWILKGGMALELRLGSRFRTTRDLDLALVSASPAAAEVQGALLEALAQDPDGDGFEFVLRSRTTLTVGPEPGSGWRFSFAVLLAARVFDRIRIDVVVLPGETVATEPLTLAPLLAFAGIDPPTVLAVDLRQHFAEKLHALTRDHGDRENSRVRDLADLLLLIDLGLLPDAALASVARRVFFARSAHPLPADLAVPPRAWEERFAALAGELGLAETTVDTAMTALRSFWSQALNTEE